MKSDDEQETTCFSPLQPLRRDDSEWNFSLIRNFSEQMDLSDVPTQCFSESAQCTREARSTEFHHSQHLTSRQRLIENYMIIWLDINDDHVAQNNVQLESLQKIASSVKLFFERDSCVDYITDFNVDERVYLILKNEDNQFLISVLKDFPQVHSIYILKTSTDDNLFSIKNYSTKVRGIFSHLDPVYDSLKMDINQSELCTIGFEVTSSIEWSLSPENTIDDKNKQDILFMYAQLLKELLLRTAETGNLKEMTDYCRQQYVDNRQQLAIIDEFERDYVLHSPVTWYSRDSFLYRMLNKALRIQEIETIYHMRLFIRDLHNELIRLSNENLLTTLTLYRGLQMTKSEFDKIRTNVGGLLSINSFMSTTENVQLASIFAGQTRLETNEVAVLLKISIADTCHHSGHVPFANIQTLSHFGDQEQEYLFTMGSVFRIESIELISFIEQVACVQLKLTDDNDPQLTALTAHLRKRLQRTSGLAAIGMLLKEKGDFEKARQFCTMAFISESNPVSKLECQFYLGSIYDKLADFRTALAYYQHCLTIARRHLPNAFPLYSSVFNNMALIFQKSGQLELAFQYMKSALTIEIENPQSEPEVLALCFNNMGVILRDQSLFDQALACFQEALNIELEYLPPTHSSIAMTYNNRASIYHSKGMYQEALNEYDNCLKIQQRCLPHDHHLNGIALHNIGMTLAQQDNWNDASVKCQQGLDILLRCLPENHREIARCYRDLLQIYSAMDMYRNHSERNNEEYSELLYSFSDMVTIMYDKGRYKEIICNSRQLIDLYSQTRLEVVQLKEMVEQLRNQASTSRN